MRPIKFRGIATEDVETSIDGIQKGEWVYGYLLNDSTISTTLIGESGGVEGCSGLVECFLSVNPKTVGQSTGQNDANGVLIFEGDIIADSQYSYRVYYIPGGFVMKAPHWSGDKSDLSLGDDLVCQPLADNQTRGYIEESCKVIGNIYDNPELLK